MSAPDNKRRSHFEELPYAQQIEAIKRLYFRDGMSVYGISAACNLAVEQVREIVGVPESEEARDV